METELTMMDLLIESHLDLERQGPGSPEMTLKALSFIESHERISKVLDLGCGTGGQTMILAQNLNAEITGIDQIKEFIDIFNDNAKKQNLQDRVKGIVGSMEELPFAEEEIDLIWSEGVLASEAFEKMLNYWNGFLKKDGYVAITSPSWFANEPPADAEKFWNDAGEKLVTIENNIEVMKKAGYEVVATFTLPEECWDNYFTPRTNAENALLAKYPGNKVAEEYVEAEKYEVELYSKYKQHYGYVFYIGKKA